MAAGVFDRLAKRSPWLMRLVKWNRARVHRYNQKKRAQYRQEFKLGVLAIMKDEEMNIAEWIEHYLWQGAGRIYLIDNGSTDRTVEIIQPWVDRGLVKLIVLTDRWKQREHYWTAIQKLRIREKCQWLLIADIDEFWFCKDGTGLADALKNYDAIDVIYANWSIFGSGGHVAHPPSVRTGFVMRRERVPPQSWTKWICKTDVIKEMKNVDIHKIVGACSSRTITDNDQFQVNHYMIQSREYFERTKMRRGDVINPANDDVRTLAYFEENDGACTIEDRRLADMALRCRREVVPPSENLIQSKPSGGHDDTTSQREEADRRRAVND